MYVSDYLSQWLQLRSSGLAARTVEQYSRLIRLHITPALGAVDMAALDPGPIQQILANLCADGHSRTAQQCYVLLHKAFKDAASSNLINAVPTARILRPRHRKAPPRYWSPDEMASFASVCPSLRWGHVWLLAMFCGLRRGELAGLRWADIDWERAMLHVRRQRQRIDGLGVIDAAPKSESSLRDIPIPPALIPLLRSALRTQRAIQLAGNQAAVFVVANLDNSPADPHRLNRSLAVDIQSASMRPVNLHGLRHSMATAAVSANVQLKILQDLLGHSSMSTTADIYAHTLPEVKITAISTIYGAICANCTP